MNSRIKELDQCLSTYSYEEGVYSSAWEDDGLSWAENIITNFQTSEWLEISSLLEQREDGWCIRLAELLETLPLSDNRDEVLRKLLKKSDNSSRLEALIRRALEE